MKAHGNGAPETCAVNLLRIVRGEVPYDRVRGVDGKLVDQPNATADAQEDAQWVLETYEPRVTVEASDTNTEGAQNGDFATLLKIGRKAGETNE